MCSNELLISNSAFTAIDVDNKEHKLTYFNTVGKEIELLSGFNMEGMLNFASISKITNSNGVKSGYMFIVGESTDAS